MKLRVDTGELSEAINLCSKVVAAGRPSTLVYSSIALAAKGDEVVLMGSDGELTVRVRIEAEVEEEGTCLVVPRPVLRYLAGFVEKKCLLEDAGAGDLVISGETSSAYRFRTVLGSFPQPPKIQGTARAVDMSQLGTGLSLVRTAVDKAKRLVQLVSTDKDLSLTTTDSYRLAQAVLPGAGFGEFTGVVPLSMLEQLGSDTTSVVIDASGRAIEFRSASVVYTARLAVGSFPAVDSILKARPERMVSIPAAEMRKAVERLSSVASSAPVWCTLGQRTLVLKVDEREVGSGEESLVIKGNVDPEMTFGLNLTYLDDALVGKADEVDLYYSDPRSPFYFCFEGDTGEASLTVAIGAAAVDG
jgi:DNA polymerase-3 subunit beta